MSSLNSFKLALLTLIISFFMAQQCEMRLHHSVSRLDQNPNFLYDANMSTHTVTTISSRKTVAL